MFRRIDILRERWHSHMYIRNLLGSFIVSYTLGIYEYVFMVWVKTT